ncbi:MAG: SDR family oxidoreductase [Rhodospirillaceae bacterium]|jgi:3-oxoacyl-[acyl-carrier protein] reductase|nr:SDR family oxidoreductase [Rhodospirillaceae bacterium]
MSVDGLVAVVTGAAQGIGYSVAQNLAKNGCVTVLFDQNEETLETARKRLSDENLEVDTQTVNVTDAEQIADAVAAVIDTHGGVDVLVNNAGISRDSRVIKMSEDDWDTVLAVNLKSQFLCCREVIPGMTERSFGRIVNISSRAWLGGFGQANYAASKGGVISLTRTLALELAKNGITANAIAPGIIDTPLFASLDQDTQEKLRMSVPVKRVGTGDDVARAVGFFADRNSDFVTGQTLYVCGGRSLSSPSV